MVVGSGRQNAVGMRCSCGRQRWRRQSPWYLVSSSPMISSGAIKNQTSFLLLFFDMDEERTEQLGETSIDPFGKKQDRRRGRPVTREKGDLERDDFRIASPSGGVASPLPSGSRCRRSGLLYVPAEAVRWARSRRRVPRHLSPSSCGASAGYQDFAMTPPSFSETQPNSAPTIIEIQMLSSGLSTMERAVNVPSLLASSA